ncbi:MAG: metallophosphoesterase [Acidobacteria bacterium]|nr:metallophosphoesterase [Acidobacteriota bacterium]
MSHPTNPILKRTSTAVCAAWVLILICRLHITAADPKPPLPSGKPAEGTFRFLVLGDAGTGKEGQLAIARRLTQFLTERTFDTVLMLGDNIYSSGKASDARAKFEQPYADLLRQNVKFFAVLGNHDVRSGRSFQIHYPNFNMGGRAYYSMAKANGLIEFFALDSTDFNDQQLNWLEVALAASKARWKVAYFHHPIYSSGKTHGSDTRLRAKLEPLFVKYGVAAALSGHDHFYERIKPQRGIQYFVCGSSGQLRQGNINPKSPLTEVGNDKVHSFLFAEASKTALTFWAIDAASNILDSVTLKAAERAQ